jgi:hypothetical protein
VLLAAFGGRAQLDLVVLALRQSRLHGRRDPSAVIGMDELQVLLVVARLSPAFEPVNGAEVLGPADDVGPDVPLPAPSLCALEDLPQERLARVERGP